MKPVLMSWSGGKDSAMALHALRGGGRYKIAALLTTVAREYQRISHHGVRVELLHRQAAAIGIPLDVIELPVGPNHACTNTVYEQLMEQALQPYLDMGVRTVAFGDIFLRDLREYRERNLAKLGMEALFPIWGRPTDQLARNFIDAGFAARLSCVDQAKLGERFAGRLLDDQLLAELPPGVDPCGENGEYHSFVFDGPLFRRPVPVKVGQIVLRDVRYFADLLLDEPDGAAAMSRDQREELT